MPYLRSAGSESILNASRSALEHLQGSENPIVSKIIRNVSGGTIIAGIVTSKSGAQSMYYQDSRRVTISFGVNSGYNHFIPSTSQSLLNASPLRIKDFTCTFADVCFAYKQYLHLVEQQICPNRERRGSWDQCEDIRSDHGINIHTISRTSNLAFGRSPRRRKRNR